MSGALASLLTVALLLTASPGVASARSLPEVEAYLDGQPIPAAEVSEHFCHDFMFPRIECYSTGSALEAALAGGTTADDAPAAVMVASDYVTIYEEAGHGGAYMHLSQDYSA